MAIRVKKIRAKDVVVGDVITAYWESGKHTRVINGEVIDIQPLGHRTERDIHTKGGEIREYWNNEPVEVQA